MKVLVDLSLGRSSHVALHPLYKGGTMHPQSFSPSSFPRKGLALRRTLLIAVAGVLLTVASCDNPGPVSPMTEDLALARAPSDGNGNKLVFPIDETFPVDCGDEELVGSAVGWIQVKLFEGAGNRNLELDVFHTVLTYTNSAGETFTFRDVGPDHYYVDDDGNLVIAITGRSTGSGVIGHVVINLTTGEVTHVAGKEFGTAEALACEALT
jgi:hypothetical protein